ncbi:hypothetical protein Tco_0997606 [Tanacetum coccineum]
MFGQILISDTYNIMSNGWGQLVYPIMGLSHFFDIDWSDSVDITNHKAVDLHNLDSRKLVPFSSLMEVCVELNASTKENDALFKLFDCLFEIGCEKFLEEEDDARRMSSSIGDDGLVRMYYILLKDATDSTIKVTYLPKDDGGLATLFRSIFDRETKKIPLDRCRLAIPRKGSIIIVTRLLDDDSMILDDCLMFTPPSKGTPPREDSFEKKLVGSCGTLHVRVDWSRG